MSYQPPPYQTTVMQPVVVQPVQPVVVPVVSGPAAGVAYRGPAFLRNGAKLCCCTVGGNWICCMSMYGVLMILVSLPTIIAITSSLDDWSATAILVANFPVLIGAPFGFISCILCIKAKKSYDEQRSQESTLPYSEPFLDARNSSAVGMGSHMYVPVQSCGVPPQTVYPQGSVVSYPNTASPASYPAKMYAVQQPSQSGINNAPGAMPYPAHPSYSAPGKGSSQEYDQPPPYAPQGYSP